MQRLIKVIYRLIFIAYFCVSLTQARDKIHFSAAYQEYNQAMGLIVLKGEASIVGPAFQISGETLQYRMQTGDILAHGNVRLVKDRDVIRAVSVRYNVKTREGKVEEFRSIMDGVFVSGKTAQMGTSRMKLLEGTATTCENELHPHYRIVAQEMILIPNEKLFLKNASFYLGERKMFSMPAYRFDLRDGAMRAPFMVAPGYNSSKGVHAKINWNFFFDEDLYGSVQMIPSSRQGMDFNLDVDANASRRAPTHLNYQQQNNQLTGNTNQRASVTQSFKEDGQDKVTLSADMLWDRYDGYATNEELNYRMTAWEDLPSGFLGKLEVQGREDPDKDKYTADSRVQNLEKLPSLQVESPTYRPENQPFQYRYGMKWTDYTESWAGAENRNNDTELYLNLYSDTIKQGDMTWSINSAGRYNNYSGTGEREYFRFNVSNSANLGSGFKLNTVYNWHHVDGSSPFQTFDRLGHDEWITQRLNYSKNHLSATLFQSSFDLKSDTLGSLSSYFRYQNAMGSRPYWIALRPSYSLGNSKNSLGDLRIDSIFYNFNLWLGDREDFDFKAQYSTKDSRWESFTSSVRFLPDEKYFVELNNHYNAVTDEFTRISLGLVKDMHCLEGRLNWDFKQEEISVQFYLKQGKSTGLGLRVGYEDRLTVSPDLPGIDENL